MDHIKIKKYFLIFNHAQNKPDVGKCGYNYKVYNVAIITGYMTQRYGTLMLTNSCKVDCWQLKIINAKLLQFDRYIWPMSSIFLISGDIFSISNDITDILIMESSLFL